MFNKNKLGRNTKSQRYQRPQQKHSFCLSHKRYGVCAHAAIERPLRGQAFETMMLVISVIVALVILGALMGILNSLPGIGGADAQQAFKEELKKIGGSYSPGTTARDAVLKPGDTVNARLLTEGTTILPDTVRFVVSPSLSTAIDTPTDDAIRANQQVQVTFVVCGDPASGASGLYVVSIAPKARGIEAADACLQEIGG